jgi:Protein of unknown function (DUF1553)/Protein of unknown function (DUF1549)/Planctomycete cytochrome C
MRLPLAVYCAILAAVLALGTGLFVAFKWVSPRDITSRISAAASSPILPSLNPQTRLPLGTTHNAATLPDFTRDVQPILERHCISCHGPVKARAGLRIDSATALHKGGDSGPAVVPGKSGESRLLLAVLGAKDVAVMPPKGPRLSLDEIATLRNWVDAGAVVPRIETIASINDRKSHWSFQPIRSSTPPTVKDTSWSRNGMDAFILARLEREDVRPSPEADRVTLLRRVALDLTGIPPTPAEVDTFLADTRPDAYERAVDRLLCSPHYGERWARHWLDAARYADSNGYSVDSPRSIWKYRDWVIDALNHNMPFDRFTTEQLAGDLLPGSTMEQKVATGFQRNTQINEEGGIDPEQFRVEAIVDRTNTVGTVFLGLTLGCCQCHDHKFDPISQKEYYQVYAFFNGSDDPKLELPGKKPAPATVATLVLNERKMPRMTTVQLGGDFVRKGATVTADVPSVLPPLGKDKATRLDLARWLVDPQHPLTARVAVNRMWQQFFGIGLVETDNDFGTQGVKPTHPELLDWLASEFVQRGWDVKAMHRLIVTSATYRQSSNARPDLQVLDPRNRLLARQNRLRLEAEVVRDVALSASGLLTQTIGGPGVYPPQPAGVYNFTQVARTWTTSTGPDRYRRGMYTFFWRSAPHPDLTVFDAPDSTVSCTRRNRSNTPLQALTLLNDEGFFECARAFAARVVKEGGTQDGERMEYAFRLVVGRSPLRKEFAILLRTLKQEREALERSPTEAEKLAGKKVDAVTLGTWTALGRVLLNLDEFITRE